MHRIENPTPVTWERSGPVQTGCQWLSMLAAGWLALASSACSHAQDFPILDFAIRPDGRAMVTVEADLQHYYLLYRGDVVTDIRTVVAMEESGPTTVQLVDPDPVPAEQSRYFRAERVPLTDPRDTDGDGIDDLYEMDRRPVLDPLDPSDALLDHDFDGRPTLAEYLAGTDPFRSDVRVPTSPTVVPPPESTTASFLTLTGTASTNGWVRVEGGASVVTNTVGAEGTYEVMVPLGPNKLNRLFVSLVEPGGDNSPPLPFDVLQDSQPPSLYVDFPAATNLLSTARTVVAGRVGDMISGYQGLHVWVHSSPSEGEAPSASTTFAVDAPQRAEVDVGIGPNGTFERPATPLVEGTNVLSVIASDRLGNRTLRRVEVVHAVPVGDRLMAISGDRQMTNVQRRLPEPLLVRAQTADGSPLAGRRLKFMVTRNNGRLLPVDTNQLAADWTLQPNAGAHGAMVLELTTDAAGEARAWWTVGNDAGCGNNRVCIEGEGLEGMAFFCASAMGNPAYQVNVGSGNNQKAEVGTWLAEPIKVWVSDGLNPVAGAAVTFRVVQGGGLVAPAEVGGGDRGVASQELTVLTRSTGHADVRFVLGPNAGQNLIEASFPGNGFLPATFVAYGLQRQPDQPGSFTGLILDNTSCPIGGAYCELSVGNAKLTTTSDGQGRFRFENVPGGTGHLYVNGATATTLFTNSIPTNSFPSLSYAVLTVPNTENSLATPVLLPRLNPRNAHTYQGTNDLVLTVEGMEGLKMTIQARSMRHADGTLVTPERPAVVSLNQVHHDNVPMPMPDGASPPFAWTLQPGGATFDPPIRIEYPNMSGLAPGSIAYFLSFNHDTERFEIVSSGHVTEDGSTILTDPESGLTIAGWGCNCPPYSVTGECRKCGPCIVDCHELSRRRLAKTESQCEDECPPFHVKDKASGVCRDVLCDYDMIKFINDEWLPLVTQLSPFFDSFFDEKERLVRESISKFDEYIQLDSLKNMPEIERALRAELMRNAFLHIYWQCCWTWSVSENFARAAGMYHENDQKKTGDPGGVFRIHSEVDGLIDLYNNELGRQIGKSAIDCDDCKTKANNAVMGRDPNNRPIVDMAYDNADPRNMEKHKLLSDDMEKLRSLVDQCPRNRNRSLLRERELSIERFQLSFEKEMIESGEATAILVPRQFKDNKYEIYYRWEKNSVTITENLEIFGRKVGRTEIALAFLDENSNVIGLGQGVAIVNSIEDIDADGMPDAWEEFHGLDIGNNDSANDMDDDGVTNLYEWFGRTDPLKLDSDNDGFSDGFEMETGMDALGLDDIPGPRWTFTALGASSIGGVDRGTRVWNISSPDQFGSGGPGTVPDFISDDYVRVIGTSSVGGSNRWAFSEFFQVRQGQTTFINDLTFTDTPPRQPERLEILSPSRTLRFGTTNQLRVIAHYADGTTNDVTRNADWTSYRLSNPVLASITPDGAIMPKAPGVVYVTASNEATTAVLGLNLTTVDNPFVTLRGRVLDHEGRAAPGVEVGLTGLESDSVVTGVDGEFQFADLPTGDVKVSVHAWLPDSMGGGWWAELREVELKQSGWTELSPLTLARLNVGTSHQWMDGGGAYTVALGVDGTLWAWGANWGGQLGDGTTVGRMTPIAIMPEARWKAVAAGSSHTMAVRADGTLFVWGSNYYGQLGDGTDVDRLTPTAIVPEERWQAVAAGEAHSVALHEDGTLWVWGWNLQGQLGDTYSEYRPTPVMPGERWRAIAVGSSHTVALREDGKLWAWGGNRNGQLGDGTTVNWLTPVAIQPEERWQEVAAGYGHTVALRADGTLWAWGANGDGQLGNGTTVDRMTPTVIMLEARWQSMAVGSSHTVALRDDGTLWAWGWNTAGQLGDGSTGNLLSPSPIQPEERWRGVAAGSAHTVALRSDGTLWAWGSNGAGQLGDGTTFNLLTPSPIQPEERWKSAAAGGNHTVALREDGILWAWGWNRNGQLGDGTRIGRLVPTEIQPEERWQAVAANYSHTVALRTNGMLYAWGSNTRGQLGDGTTVDRPTPSVIMPEARWKGVAAGDLHTVALQTNGTLWAWGSNTRGQLGDGTTEDRLTPGLIMPEERWQAVSVGDHHTVALHADGTIWAWGSNLHGQLGDGTTENRLMPKAIVPGVRWRAVAAAYSRTAAVQEDGTLWTWGANGNGQLGDGTTVRRLIPTAVQPEARWQVVTAGLHTVALRVDGTLWAWGFNENGQLGDGTTTDRLTPTAIVPAERWKEVAAGENHTVALRVDGTLWAWGANQTGQLGISPWRQVLGSAIWGPPTP